MVKTPKGKLLALIAVFAAIGLITATGAFTSVQADRTVSVQVANDSQALLALNAHSGTNGQYASFTADGQLTVDFSSSNLGDASGVNPNADTTFDNVFNVTNQGTQTVDVTLTSNTSNVLLYQGTDSSSASTSLSVNSVGTASDVQVSLKLNSSSFGEGESFGATINVSASA